MDRAKKPDALAAWIMAAFLLREVGWSWFPAEHQGMASKALGSLLVLFLAGVVWHLAKRSKWLLAALAYGIWSALQTVICSIAYMVQPWAVSPGQGICSARIDFDLGALGLMAAAFFAVRAAGVTSYSITNEK